MIAAIDQELSELDQLKGCLELRLILDGRIENGAKFCTNLLLETDAENPKYLLHKSRLENLRDTRESNELHIWVLWKRTNAKVELEIPKTKGFEHPLVVLSDPDGSAGFSPREMCQAATSWIYTVTFDEFKRLLAPFLFPDMELNF